VQAEFAVVEIEEDYLWEAFEEVSQKVQQLEARWALQ